MIIEVSLYLHVYSFVQVLLASMAKFTCFNCECKQNVFYVQLEAFAHQRELNIKDMVHIFGQRLEVTTQVEHHVLLAECKMDDQEGLHLDTARQEGYGVKWTSVSAETVS